MQTGNLCGADPLIFAHSVGLSNRKATPWKPLAVFFLEFRANELCIIYSEGAASAAIIFRIIKEALRRPVALL